MLKTNRGSEVWLITQPAHAELAGHLAARWGNEQFSAPGGFAACPDSDRLRREVVLAVASHDNGWWEWEAAPPVSATDGLPQGLGEVVADPATGMERWRLGVSRLAERHPYASLLIGEHASWLYESEANRRRFPEFTHPLSIGRVFDPADHEDEVPRFLADVRHRQRGFVRRLEQDTFWQTALVPAQRHPHTRLLQTLDVLSLALCSDVVPPVGVAAKKGLGEDHIVLRDVPRRGWDDRVSLEIAPLGEGRLVIDPYPFDDAPLAVTVPARVIPPGTWWQQAPWVLKAFTFVRRT